MTTFLVGTNRFEDCATLVAYRGSAVLRVEIDSSSTPVIDLQMPPDTVPLVIEQNVVTQGDGEVIARPMVTSVLHRDTLVLHAVTSGAGPILVHLDLRPLGAAIYTDAAGLHVGANVLSGNTVRGANIAIGLG